MPNDHSAAHTDDLARHSEALQLAALTVLRVMDLHGYGRRDALPEFQDQLRRHLELSFHRLTAGPHPQAAEIVATMMAVADGAHAPRKGSFEAVFGHLGTPEEVANEWCRMQQAISQLRAASDQDCAGGDLPACHAARDQEAHWARWTNACNRMGWNVESQLIHLEGFIRERGLAEGLANYAEAVADEEDDSYEEQSSSERPA